MRKLVWLILGVLMNSFVQAQVVDPIFDKQAERDSLQAFGEREVAGDSLKVHRPVITDYTYWREKDKTVSVIDTTMTIEGLYQQNFTHQDVFGKMFFPNFGQTFNPLEYQNARFRLHLLPTGKSFNYLFPEDIRYYNVKTPMTEFVFENGLREGQYLSTVFTQNLSPQFNYSVRYRGLRSVGRYSNNLAANNALILTLNHHSKNQKFKLWSHFAAQNIDNEENAGIKHLEEFEQDDENSTTNRQNIAVNLNSAYTEYDSRRFHLGASYGLFGSSKSDSTSTQSPIRLKNVLSYEKQKFFYHEPQNENYFTSPVFTNFDRRNLKSMEILQNTSSVEFNWGDKLWLEAGLRYEQLKLYSPESLEQGLVYIPKSIDDHLLGAVGNLYFDWNEKLKLQADVEFKSGDIFKSQYHLNATLDIQPLDGYHLVVGGLLESSFPSINLFYNQSFYKDFNYYNRSFKNTQTQKLFGRLEFKKFNTQIEANLYNIDQLVYVDTDFRPKQLNGNVSLYQIKAENLLTYRKFNLRTTLEYQQVTNNADFLPLPDLIGRASLYWQSRVFDNKAEAQIGFNATYFSEFQSREFFPVINEFMIQRTHPEYGIQKIGNYPVLDFFMNLKVQRMQIFFRADHFNSLFGKNNYYSAPFTPFRDFKIQFGLKWYLFT